MKINRCNQPEELGAYSKYWWPLRDSHDKENFNKHLTYIDIIYGNFKKMRNTAMSWFFDENSHISLHGCQLITVLERSLGSRLVMTASELS